MNLQQALEAMEDGNSVRRTDWCHQKCTYISLLPHNGFYNFYITGKYDMNPEIREEYSMGYYDVTSNSWEIVDETISRNHSK